MHKLNFILKGLLIGVFFINGSLLNSKAFSQPGPLLAADYLSFIQQRISSYFIYPKEARIKGWEGIVNVKVTLAPDGRIKNIDVVKSSGYPLLDAAAILTLKDASPYPFPQSYPQEEIELIVPVNFSKAEQPDNLPTQGQNAEKEKPVVTPGELTNFVSLAIANNPPIKVALKEVQLASLKVTEAQRGFLPGLKVQGYTTAGQVYHVDYEEREIKAQAEQPIYYSGKLTQTLKQAQVNLTITKKNYDRLKLDVVQKTETAYYNLVSARMHLKQKQAVREEAKEIYNKIEKLKRADMVIPLELNSAKSWLEQIGSQIKSIEHEVAMAELTLKQVLNVTGPIKTEEENLTMKDLGLEINKCVEIAFKNRPEIELSELLIKFNEHGQKIEASKSMLNVDLTTSLGLYQGHYKTEPWKNSSNWYAGLKVTKPWGGNTINSSYSSDHTRPRLGQADPTLSSTLSGEFNFLDNMKLISDKKRADIDFSRARSDYNETLKTMVFEVQDAFLKYEKAIFQLNTAEAEMKFRRNEADVKRIRAMVGENNLSDALEALYGLSEAQSKHIQAIANYFISLANLRKATGYGLKI